MTAPDDRRAALCDWLTANGIDPCHVPTHAELYVDTDDNGTRVLHCEQFETDDNGRHILDERGDEAAIRHATVPLLVAPPEWWQPHVKPTREQLTEQLNAAYTERAHLLGWLAALHPAVLAPAEDQADDGWQILYITVAGSQMSWHIHPKDAGLFSQIEHVPADDPRAQWDGHTTAEKYHRIRRHTHTVASRSAR